MKILTTWLRALLPDLTVSDAQLAEDLTLRGIAVEGVHNLGAGNGSLFEMDITTNRVDAMNHYGVAREAAAIYGLKIKPIQASLPGAQPALSAFPVRIEASDACGRFTARILRNVTIGESKGDVARYFELLEQKRISSAVDATNFGWLAMGHPTHAFDLDKIEGGIVVRRARAGEKLKTLDGIERILESEDLVVADEVKPLALAGVMGGWESMITPETKNVLVEAAWFDQVAVRRTARRHGLHTDASHRFERGADIAAAPLASALVAKIILSSGGQDGGYLEGELVDSAVPEILAKTVDRKPVALALSEVHRMLGTTIDPEGITAGAVVSMLTALGCKLTAAGEDVWTVALPSWRLDIEREIDLIEEIARVYGYNRFANTLPAFAGGVRELPYSAADVALRSTLRAAGLHETIASTFTSAKDAALFVPQVGVVPLGNPLSEEAGVMRPSLVPGLVASVAGNLHRDVGDVRLFELGTVFSGTTEKVEENPALAFALAGKIAEQGTRHAVRELDFYDAKGVVEQLLEQFATQSAYFDSFPPDTGLTPGWLHPYRSARVVAEGETVGWFGQLHPRLATERKLRQTVFAGELSLERLYKLPLRRPVVQEISRFQPVRRDFSLVLPVKLTWAELNSVLAALALPELIDWRAREIRQDVQQGDSYSLLLGVTFQAADRTLREEELREFSRQVLAAVEAVGGSLRA